jgi:hypothetical protein
MVSANGNSVPNQFIIHSAHGKLFRSYDSNIAFKPNDESTVYLGKDWKYSRTTLKYLNRFLNGQTAAETRQKLADGIYKLELNL